MTSTSKDFYVAYISRTAFLIWLKELDQDFLEVAKRFLIDMPQVAISSLSMHAHQAMPWHISDISY